MSSIAFTIIVITAVLSGALTGVVRRYALARDIVDEPNERGLAQRTVPRGGGIAIVIAVSAALAALAASAEVAPALAALWIAGGLAFGVLGFADDHVSLSAKFRLGLQLIFSAAFCFTLWQLQIPSWAASLSTLHLAFATLICAGVGAWVVNLTNFMDGADGFVSVHAIFVCIVGASIELTSNSQIWLFGFVAAAACTGFLVWNWPPARIFMGDAGSYFLGFQFFAFVVYAVFSDATVWPWLILLSPFVIDASLTLLRRMWAGQHWWQAHREHVYQRFVLSGWSHQRLIASLLLLNSLFVMPMAYIAARNVSLAAWLTSTTYVLTGIMWVTAYRYTRKHTNAR